MRPALRLLERTTFETSRLLEFFSEKELTMQIGQPRWLWPLALLKELIDNALDACDLTGIAPCIIVSVGTDYFSVQDNGPGLPIATLERSLDYLVRVSDKNHYVSPTRGQLGNALKCVWAAPFVVDGEHGFVIVHTAGQRHTIDVRLDHIAQAPKLEHSVCADSTVETGTRLTLHWPEIASSHDPYPSASFYKRVINLVDAYAACNPHTSFEVTEVPATYDGCTASWERGVGRWTHWLPNEPTSPHWYTPERLAGLVAAYLAEEARGGRARTVREFVSEFRGLSGTAKQKVVTTNAELSGARLRDLIAGDDVDHERIARLLEAMQAESRPVPPQALGHIGEEHLTAHLVDTFAVRPESVRYRHKQGTVDGVPFVLETALGVRRDRDRGRTITIGLNWSPAIGQPFQRLDELLGVARIDPHDPIAVVIHVATPRLEFTDRGKGVLALTLLGSALHDALASSLKTISKDWTELKRRANRQQYVRQRDLEHFRTERQDVSIKAAAWQVMEQAYMKASSHGRLPANARQIMYAARPLVQALTGGKLWKKDTYFTQTLLPDYVSTYVERCGDWDIAFDDRGHFREPHTDHQLGLGTLNVRAYRQSWQAEAQTELPPVEALFAGLSKLVTHGPGYRFGAVLFLEKEGFNELLERQSVRERFDLAIMSTKGMSVTAARDLVTALSQSRIPTYVVRDFDKAGFSIVNTLRRDTRRFQFRLRPLVTDLGLRLDDIQELGLDSEEVTYDGNKDPRINLHASGATSAECDYLVRGRRYGQWTGQRVELNAMDSEQFINWLERKLISAGVQKLVPDDDVLAATYRRARGIARMRAQLEALHLQVEDREPIPADLAEQIRLCLSEDDGLAWDVAVWDIASRRTAEFNQR
jgi:DNA topoisomerase VI subunit B